VADVLDPFALITASQAAKYAHVSVAAVVNWRARGHLTVASHDAQGRPLYTLLDVARAEYHTRKRARRT
jgi:hypothetical protein